MYDKIYCINLDKRTDRWEEFQRDVLEGLELDKDKFERISAIDTSGLSGKDTGAIGCSLSHLKIWKDVIDNGYNSVLIFEDDFEPIVSKDKFHDVIHEAYDVGFGVCSLDWSAGGNKYNSIHAKLSDNIWFMNQTVLCSGYIITLEYAKRMVHGLSNAITDLMINGPSWENTLDTYWLQFQDRGWVVCNPKIGRQRIGMSNIANVIVKRW